MTIVKTPLNRYVVEMVKPDTCIRHRGGFGYVESQVCDKCFLCNGNNCEYEKIIVNYAKGRYQSLYDNRDIDFEQFCCPKCGEIISEHSERMIDWKRIDIKCNHCKTEYVCLEDDYENEKLTLARKPLK